MTCTRPRAARQNPLATRAPSTHAPEIDLTLIDPAADLREALDIDSMDFLNFVRAIHHRLGVDIPELDYPKLFTLAGAVAYVENKLKPARRKRSTACA